MSDTIGGTEMLCQRIRDLEAKLAESKEEIEDLDKEAVAFQSSMHKAIAERDEYIAAMQGILMTLRGNKTVHSTLIKEVTRAVEEVAKERDEALHKLTRSRPYDPAKEDLMQALEQSNKENDQLRARVAELEKKLEG